MATTTAKSYHDVPNSHHEGAITAAYVWDDGANNPLGTDGDILRFFKLPRRAKLLDAILEVESLGASASTVSVKITDGTTTYSLMVDKDGTSTALFRADGTGWLGKVLDSTGQWYAYVEATATAGTPTSDPYVALSVTYTMDLASGDI